MRHLRGRPYRPETDVDVGHTAPQCTLPIGCVAELDSEHRYFAIVEAAVSD